MTAMQRFLYVGTGLLALGMVLSGCGKPSDDTPSAQIAVTNSYLHAMVRDLCGQEMSVFSVVPPGMCPGHFDVKPADVRRLHQCRLLLAFDFQESIARILPDNGRGPRFASIGVPAGMCKPDSYLTMAHDTAEILIAEYPSREATFRKRLAQIAERMKSLEAECAAAIETLKLREAPVLTSRHQAVFAEWLGLEPVASFSGGEAETAAHINAALGASQGRALRCIIANRQEGTQLAEALAERLDVPVAVFSNFPDAPDRAASAPAFDALVRDNLRRLAEATP